MIEGTLIADSLRVGTNLENLKLTVRKISRYRARGTTPDQLEIWTTLDFEAEEAEAGELAQAFAGALDDQPSWYVNFQSPVESFVVFPGRISATRGAMRVAGPRLRLTGGNSRSQSRSWTTRCEAKRGHEGHSRRECQVNHTASDLPAAATGDTRRYQCCTEIFVVSTAGFNVRVNLAAEIFVVRLKLRVASGGRIGRRRLGSLR